MRYAAVGVAVIAIAAVAVTSLSLQPKSGGNLALNSGGVTIQNVGANAFGKLSAANTTNSGAAATSNTGAPTAGGAAASPMMAPAVGAPAASPLKNSVIAMPIRPPGYFPTVKYDYTGAAFTQDQAQLNVLKKTAQPLTADQATNALEQAGFGQINLASFSGLSMSNVTLSQNQSFGYQITLDLADGTISINQNYNEWPQGNTTPLKASDIPSDSAVIATANQFMKDHAISLANYGTPTVTQNNNLIVPMGVATPAVSANGGSGSSGGGVASAPSAGLMIPYYSDSEQVLYPLIVNDMSVYDTNGNQIGLTVEVNVRYNRVANVYGLSTESYQASAYDAITNTSTILSMAETSPTYPIIYNGSNGGVMLNNNTAADGTGSTVTTYDLGTPKMVYEDIYQSDSNGQSNEFLVPAFVFPVIGNAADTATRNIMVPLIQDFAQQNNGGVGVVPYDVNATTGK